MSRPQVLIVEDERLIADDLRSRLTRLGYAVSALAASGEEALQQVAAKRPDLVLMDISLSGRMDGIQTASQLRAQFHIPVVYLTAHANDETVSRAKQTEPLGYILKPYEEQALHRTLQFALYKARMARLGGDRKLA